MARREFSIFIFFLMHNSEYIHICSVSYISDFNQYQCDSIPCLITSMHSSIAPEVSPRASVRLAEPITE